MSILQATMNNNSYLLHHSDLTPEECMMYARIITRKFAYAEVMGCSILDQRLVAECKSLAVPQLSTFRLVVAINYDELMFEAVRLQLAQTIDPNCVKGVAIYSSSDCAQWVTPIHQLDAHWRS